MNIEWIDISREWLSAPVYPGDPAPRLEKLSDMHFGDACNTSSLTACVHTGTHIDAPLHFFEGAGDVTTIPLSVCCGDCCVIEAKGTLVGEHLETYAWMVPPRVLFKGDVHLTQSAAFVLIDAGVRLIGVEGTSVAATTEEAEVHRLLLSSGVVIIEGLDLSAVKAGQYLLSAAPVKIA
ncbi:MAG: cyclase family protein, partial [Clostridia bacterium]|nr:cyclase family protein [Clostridia bacterium]